MNKQQTRKSTSGRTKVTAKRAAPAKAAVKVFARPKSKAAVKAKSAPISASVGKFLASSLAGLIPGAGGALSGIAGAAGGWLGNKIGTFLGLGDYRVRQNSLMGNGQQLPMMHNAGDEIIIRHREFLGNVHSSATQGAFSVQNYELNPGLMTSFPWASISAKAYKEWRPHGMMFEFVSNTGLVSNASTPAIGMVIMATDYNAGDPTPFQSKLEMDNNMYTTTAKSSDSFLHPIECDPSDNLLRKFFLRSGDIPDNQPRQMYDLGVFSIASEGQPTANQNLGELWCTFEIGFSKATLQNAVDDEAPTDMFYFTLPNNTEPFREPLAASNTLGGTIQTNGGPGIYLFPDRRTQGDFLLTYYCTMNVAATDVAFGQLVYANCVNETAEWQYGGQPVQNINPALGVFGAGGYQAAGNPPGGAYCLMVLKVRITGPGAYILFPSGASAWSGAAWLLVCPISHKVSFAPPMVGHRPNLYKPGRPKMVVIGEEVSGRTVEHIVDRTSNRGCQAEPDDSDDEARDERVAVLLEQLERLRFMEHQHQLTKKSKIDSF